jgi:hypothetical protein
MAHDKTRSVPSRFQPGDKLRVKHGVRDPDFPDIPLGGWVGTVKEVRQAEGETTLLIAWDRATLRGMHPIYKKRCERDGLELESMWLGDEDLEPDDGAPVSVEQPTSIITKPLSEKDQDDRVRMALGLTHDDPLPEVNHKNLLTYHRYLTRNLVFPFKAGTRSRWAGRSESGCRSPSPACCDRTSARSMSSTGSSVPGVLPKNESISRWLRSRSRGQVRVAG